MLLSDFIFLYYVILLGFYFKVLHSDFDLIFHLLYLFKEKTKKTEII